jgi:O-Antigen ligase
VADGTMPLALVPPAAVRPQGLARPWGTIANPVCWCLILSFVILTAMLLLVHQGQLLLLAFPAGALVLGFVLYVVAPPLFLGFAWWLWFLTPEVRRIVDYQTAWHVTSTIMLAPYLVSGLSLLTACHRLPLLRRREMAPFAGIFAALAYGTLVGVIKESPPAAIFGFLTWGVPAALAFHIASIPETYPDLSRSLLRTFVWGGLVMGAYGLIQYFVMPDWDAYWLLNVDMQNQGLPLPQEVRVFSTMNSSGPFAFVLMTSLLMLFVGGGPLRLPAAALGYSSFFLSLVRAAWIGWSIGLVFLAIRLRGRARIMLVTAALGTTIVVVPVVMLSPFAETISERFATFGTLEDDESYQDRREFYRDFLTVAVTTVEGAGIGSTGVSTKLTYGSEPSKYANFDSGLMQVPFVLGWFGSAAYIIGILLLMRTVAFSPSAPHDRMAVAARAIALSFLLLMTFENSLVGVEGATFWSFLGLALAAVRHERSASMDPVGVPTIAEQGASLLR